MKDELKKIKRKKAEQKPSTSETSGEPSGKAASSSSSSDHTDRDGVGWGSKESRKAVRSLKNFHDSATHMAVMENDPQRLRDLLEKGLSV